MRPSAWLAVLLALSIGAAVGMGGFTFVYGQGASYLTNDPQACANCHIMGEQYSGWLQSSHRAVATCNDCHAPHDLVGKYWTKARNGYAHSYAFTTGDYPERLRIKKANLEVTESACRHCHEELVGAVDADGSEPRACVQCHSDVGHRGLAPLTFTPSASSGATNEVSFHD